MDGMQRRETNFAINMTQLIVRIGGMSSKGNEQVVGPTKRKPHGLSVDCLNSTNNGLKSSIPMFVKREERNTERSPGVFAMVGLTT